MFEVVNSIKPLKDRIQFFLLGVLCCFSILPTGIQSVTIMLFAAVSIVFQFNTIKKQVTIKKLKVFFIIIFWLLMLGFSLLYSFELKAGIIYFRKAVNLIIIPFLILYTLPSIRIEHIEFLLKIFVLSSLILIFYIGFILIKNLLSYASLMGAHTAYDQFIFIINLSHPEIMWYGIKEANKPILMIHKTYLSLNFVFSIFIILFVFFRKETFLKKKVLMAGMIILFMSPIFFFFSFVNILLLFVGLFVFGLVYIKSIKYRLLYSVLGVLFITLTGIYTYSYAKEHKDSSIIAKSIVKKVNYVKSFVTINTNKQNEEVDERKLIFDCSIELFKKAPLLGYGLGVQHIYLTDCYAKKGNFVLVEDNYNTHNFYLFILLSGGIVALIPFIIMFGYFFRCAWEERSILFITFLLLIFSNLLVENVLSRINGILFVAIFLPLLYSYSNKSLRNVVNRNIS